LAVSPEGEYLLTCASEAGGLDIVRLHDGAIIDRIDLCESDDRISSAVWSPDGTRVLAGTWRGLLIDFDFAQNAAASAPPLSPENLKRPAGCP
jgi:WD40 repeat protein